MEQSKNRLLTDFMSQNHKNNHKEVIMKKIVSMLMLLVMVTMLFAGCNGSDDSSSSSKDNAESNESTSGGDESTNGNSEEMVDGKFVETRKITVEVFDRGNDGGSTPEDNFYAEFIKEGMLRDHNIEVEFIPVPRWTEVEQINNLLAAGDAPDICVTYDYPTIQTYANMGGVTDMAPHIEANKELLPDLFDLLTEQNIYYNQDPNEGTIWAIEARLVNLARINTFIRKDWLETLNIKEPTTEEEFEAALIAFRDNANLLLGGEADRMIPFSISFDVGWRADHLLQSKIPSSTTEKEHYTLGFDDRHLLMPGIKDGIELLNSWYNDGLIWKDFPLYGSGDTTEDNLMKAGYVGAFMHNWDYPYRNGDDSINNSLKRLAGDEAGYVAISPFKNDSGIYAKYRTAPVDRKVFFPITNDEPVASLLYLNWISQLENRMFLQIGEEGVTHEVVENGAIRTIATTGDKIMNSPSNIDYTITINGLDLGDKALTIQSMALGYVGVDSSVIQQAYEKSTDGNVFLENHNFGEITAETGMGPALSEKRDTLLTQSIVASPDKFDQVFDNGMKDYLNSGGQAIIDERTKAWDTTY